MTLAEGRTGLAQLALHTEKRIVPVACNNSEEVYTGSLPFAKSGRITYRIGEPLSVHDRLKEFRIREPFRLLSRESQQRYREQFEGVTRIVMASIEGMLDEKYRRGMPRPEARIAERRGTGQQVHPFRPDFPSDIPHPFSTISQPEACCGRNECAFAARRTGRRKRRAPSF